MNDKKIAKKLLLSIAVSVVMNQAVLAKGIEDEESFFQRASSAAASFYNYAKGATLVDEVNSRGKAFALNKAEEFLASKGDEIGRLAAKQLHAQLYRHADIHVVDDQGNHIGFVEDINPKVTRNLVKKILGFDLEKDIPGVPAFVAKKIMDMLEKQIAGYLENQTQVALQKAVTQVSMKAIQKGLGVTQNAIQALNFDDILSAQAKTKVEEALTQVEGLSMEDRSIAGELAMAVQAQFKSVARGWVNDAANLVAGKFIKETIDYAGEGMLRGAEVTTATLGSAAAFATMGPVGAYTAGGMIAGDNYLAEGAKQESYLRRFAKWATGFDERKALAEKKVVSAAQNQINGSLDTALESAGLGLLVLSDDENALVNGAYSSTEEDEFGFTNIVKTKEAYSFSSFKDRLVQTAKEKADRAVQQAKKNAIKVTEEAGRVVQQAKENAVKITEDLGAAANTFCVAMGPGLAYDDEPVEMSEAEIAQQKEAAVLAQYEKELIEGYGASSESAEEPTSWFSRWWNS